MLNFLKTSSNCEGVFQLNFIKIQLKLILVLASLKKIEVQGHSLLAFSFVFGTKSAINVSLFSMTIPLCHPYNLDEDDTTFIFNKKVCKTPQNK